MHTNCLYWEMILLTNGFICSCMVFPLTSIHRNTACDVVTSTFVPFAYPYIAFAHTIHNFCYEAFTHSTRSTVRASESVCGGKGERESIENFKLFENVISIVRVCNTMHNAEKPQSLPFHSTQLCSVFVLATLFMLFSYHSYTKVCILEQQSRNSDYE